MLLPWSRAVSGMSRDSSSRWNVLRKARNSWIVNALLYCRKALSR
jgi:hypothetical protein